MSDLDIHGREDGSNERLDCIEDQGRAEDKAIWSVRIGRDFLLEHCPQSADQPQTWKGRYKNEGYMRSGRQIADANVENAAGEAKSRLCHWGPGFVVA